MPRRAKSRRITRKLIVYAEIAAIIDLLAGVLGLFIVGIALLLEHL